MVVSSNMAATRTSSRLQIAVRAALSNALLFVAERFDWHTGWADFQTNSSGESTSWVTGHVLWNLSDLLPNAIVTRAEEILLDQRQSDGLWGFSPAVPSDHDSTLNVALGLLRCGHHKRLVLYDILPRISKGIHSSGALGTFPNATRIAIHRNETDISNLSGWTAGHPCVSALAFLLFSECRLRGSASAISLASYLSHIFTTYNYIPAYWWCSKVYSTSMIALAGWTPESSSNRLTFKCRKYLFSLLCKTNGLISYHDSLAFCPLDSSRAVLPMIFVLPMRILLNYINHILEHQEINGSWISGPSLRIPPSNIQLNELDSISFHQSHGVYSISSDSKHIYTTSLVARTLSLLLLALSKEHIGEQLN